MERRNKITAVVACVGIIILALDMNTALKSGRSAIQICFQTVIPALFPFFVLSRLLTGALATVRFRSLLLPAKILGIPDGAEGILIPAFLGGYPVGASCIHSAWKNGQISEHTARQLMAFCSNAGPSFLFGMIGLQFPHMKAVWILWGIHILGAVCVSFLFPVQEKKATVSCVASPDLPGSMYTALHAMAAVCGWILLFQVVIGFIDRWFLWRFPEWCQVALSGFLELSSGCCSLSLVADPDLRFVLCAVMLGFGGVCVMLQTAAVTDGLPLRTYIKGKLLHGMFSGFLAAAYVWNSWYLMVPAVILFLQFFRKREKVVAFPSPMVYNMVQRSLEDKLCCFEKK